MAHTPGPWKASETYPAGDWCVHAQGIPWQLAYLHASSQVEWPLEANARLIAAAPDLLEALEDADASLAQALGLIVEFGDLNGFRNLSNEELGRAVVCVAERCAESRNAARAALAKTRGE